MDNEQFASFDSFCLDKLCVCAFYRMNIKFVFHCSKTDGEVCLSIESVGFHVKNIIILFSWKDNILGL